MTLRQTPKGLAEEKAEWLNPGLIGLVRTLEAEEMLRHASLKDSGSGISGLEPRSPPDVPVE
ncbi:hypothetical protein [Mesorhizobium captivum]|uniref:hypothetical protein n=1 Tax=Mesorhizobium captivum TaxID=3072319 RepID=UPI002A240671|nr:hypothetical protein [Mesorhizobium sp. VK3C]MDX8449921.1 hypothetical protein [Mesorhizobium sp. VK3C]